MLILLPLLLAHRPLFHVTQVFLSLFLAICSPTEALKVLLILMVSLPKRTIFMNSHTFLSTFR